MRFILIIIAIYSFFLSDGIAKDPKRHVSINTMPEFSQVKPGGNLRIAIEFKIEKGWNIYWVNPGDAGMATSIEWILPEIIDSKRVYTQFPIPKRTISGEIGDYIYEGKAVIVTTIPIPANVPIGTELNLKGRIDFLQCHEICIPGNADVEVKVTVGNESKLISKNRNAILSALKNMPCLAEDWKVSYNFVDSNFVLSISRPDGTLPKFNKLVFMPKTEGQICNWGKQTLAVVGNKYQLSIPLDKMRSGRPDSIFGIIVADKPWDKKGTRALMFGYATVYTE